jgi:SanA protein
VAIGFGAGYWPSGALSDILRDRLDAAIELYRAQRVEKLLFSGDNRFVDYSEPAKMLEYAMIQGIPREDIILDYAGRRTYDTCYRARAIFQVQEAILVTQRYHLPRALNTCHALGIDADGYGAARVPYVHIRGIGCAKSRPLALLVGPLRRTSAAGSRRPAPDLPIGRLHPVAE